MQLEIFEIFNIPIYNTIAIGRNNNKQAPLALSAISLLQETAYYIRRGHPNTYIIFLQ